MPKEKDVLKAIQEILREGQVPSLRAVVKRTGGSHRDVLPILRRWKQERTKAVPPKVSALVREYRTLDPLDQKMFQDLTVLRPLSREKVFRRLAVLNRRQGGAIGRALKAVADLDDGNVIPLPTRPRKALTRRRKTPPGRKRLGV